MIAISACLAGKKCRYDGGCKTDEQLVELFERGEALLICPEVMGGMEIPRRPSEIDGSAEDVLCEKARVMNNAGEDVTDYFIKGAYAALEFCEKNGIKKAILKANSPSCGCGQVYDGMFSGKLTAGDGVTAYLLKKHGIEVICR